MKICREVRRGVFAPFLKWETKVVCIFLEKSPTECQVFRHPSPAYPIDTLQAFKFVLVRSYRGTANRERNGIDDISWEMGQTETLGNWDSTAPILPIPGDSYETKRAITNNTKAKKLGHAPHQNNFVHVPSQKGMNPRLWCKSLMSNSPVRSTATQKSLFS